MFVKIHRAYRTVVAMCDSELLGKKFEEGIKQLDVRTSFYKEEEVSHERAVTILKFQAREDATFNIVGPKSIEAAKEAGLITKDSIGYVDNVPFALILI